MSIPILKSIFESQEFKSTTQTTLGLEISLSRSQFPIILKILERNLADKRSLVLLNFDINFCKFLQEQIVFKANNFVNKNYTNFSLSNCISSLSYERIHIINIFSYQSLINQTKIIKEILKGLGVNNDTAKQFNTTIVGLDLLNINQIKAFFLENHNLLFNFTYLFYFLSVDKSNLNLNERNEEKKSFIKKKLSIFIEEMETISRNNKKIQLMEVNNLMKLTVEKVVFEFGIEDKKVIFEKVNLYLQEHKDIFEQNNNTNEKVEPEIEPSSTFKLSLNKNELNARNDVILPFIKEQGEKGGGAVIIDQEDLNELYEEDPDGDLDF